MPDGQTGLDIQELDARFPPRISVGAVGPAHWLTVQPAVDFRGTIEGIASRIAARTRNPRDRCRLLLRSRRPAPITTIADSFRQKPPPASGVSAALERHRALETRGAPWGWPPDR